MKGTYTISVENGTTSSLRGMQGIGIRGEGGIWLRDGFRELFSDCNRILVMKRVTIGNHQKRFGSDDDDDDDDGDA